MDFTNEQSIAVGFKRARLDDNCIPDYDTTNYEPTETCINHRDTKKFIRACILSNREEAIRLAKHGDLIPTYMDDYDNNILLVATKFSMFDVVLELLERFDFDFSIPNCMGETILMQTQVPTGWNKFMLTVGEESAWSHRNKLYEKLLSKKCNINQVDNNGISIMTMLGYKINITKEALDTDSFSFFKNLINYKHEVLNDIYLDEKKETTLLLNLIPISKCEEADNFIINIIKFGSVLLPKRTLFSAISHKKLEMVKTLLIMDPTLMNAVDADNNNILMHATCIENNNDIVDYLVSSDYNFYECINTSAYKTNALIMATLHKYMNVINKSIDMYPNSIKVNVTLKFNIVYHICAMLIAEEEKILMLEKIYNAGIKTINGDGFLEYICLDEKSLYNKFSDDFLINYRTPKNSNALFVFYYMKKYDMLNKCLDLGISCYEKNNENNCAYDCNPTFFKELETKRIAESKELAYKTKISTLETKIDSMESKMDFMISMMSKIGLTTK